MLCVTHRRLRLRLLHDKLPELHLEARRGLCIRAVDQNARLAANCRMDPNVTFDRNPFRNSKYESRDLAAGKEMAFPICF